MSKMQFQDLLLEKDGLIKGPFGGDIKKSLFVPKSKSTYKVFEQGVVLKNDVNFGQYYVSKEHFDKKLKRFEVKSGDILMTGAGTLGKLFFVPKNYPAGVINQALLRIRLNKNVVAPIFFKYYFKYYIKAIISRLNSDSVIPNLPPLPIIKSTDIDIPNLLTQKQIAKVFSDLDAKIELNNKINKELEAMAKTLYDYWFVQFDFPNEQGKPYKSSGGKMVYNEELKREIPEGWEVKKLGAYAKIKKGALLTEKEADKNGNVKVVSAGLDYSYLHSMSNYAENTITISASGANAGFVNFWREPIFACDCTTVRGWNDVETLIILEFLKMHQKYLYLQARGSAQPHVYPGDVELLLISIPHNDLIINFGGKVLEANNLIANNTKQNQQLTALRDWLLPMLMNGQVTVAEAEKKLSSTSDLSRSMAAEPQAIAKS